MVSSGRPRLHPPTFRFPFASYMRRGDRLHRADRAWIRASYALPPDLRATWWRCAPDGRLDRRVKHWYTRAQAGEYRYFVEDDVSWELNR